MIKWHPIETVPLDGRPVILDWGGGVVMIGEWTTKLSAIGCWQGVLVDPAAERAFQEDGDPDDEPPRYSLTVGGGDLLGWAPLPQPEEAEA